MIATPATPSSQNSLLDPPLAASVPTPPGNNVLVACPDPCLIRSSSSGGVGPRPPPLSSGPLAPRAASAYCCRRLASRRLDYSMALKINPFELECISVFMIGVSIRRLASCGSCPARFVHLRGLSPIHKFPARYRTVAHLMRNATASSVPLQFAGPTQLYAPVKMLDLASVIMTFARVDRSIRN